MSPLNKKVYAATLLVLTTGMIFLTGCSGSQKLAEPGSSVKLNYDILLGPGTCILKQFQGTSVNNKFYLNWVVLSNTEGFIFQLEQSADGRRFEPCYVRKGMSSPNSSTPVLYCVVDSMAMGEIVFFRIKAIPEDFYMSKTIKQDHNEIFSASTICLRRNLRSRTYSLSSN